MNEVEGNKQSESWEEKKDRHAGIVKVAYVNAYWSHRSRNDEGHQEVLTPLGPTAHIDLRHRFPSGKFTSGMHRLEDQFEAIASIFLAMYPPPVYRVLLELKPPAQQILGGRGSRMQEGFYENLVGKAKQYLADKQRALEGITVPPEFSDGTGPFCHVYLIEAGADAKRWVGEIQRGAWKNYKD